MKENTYEWKTISNNGMPTDNGGYFVTVQITDADFPFQNSIFATICDYRDNRFENILMKKEMKDKIRKYRIVSYTRFPLLCLNNLEYPFASPMENDVMSNNILWYE